MVTDRSCNNQLFTTELVVQCRKFQLLTELREWTRCSAIAERPRCRV